MHLILTSSFLWSFSCVYLSFCISRVTTSSSGVTTKNESCVRSNFNPFLKEVLAERIIGSDKAKLTVVEYFSFTCPACGRFHTDVYPKLKEKYVDTGLVKFEFRDFPLDQWALRASALARCVPSKFYEPMVSVLMKQQSLWAGSRRCWRGTVKTRSTCWIK